MRRPHAAAAVLLLWLAVLTFAFHGRGRLLGCCGGVVARPSSAVSLPRKMLLAVVASSDDDVGASAPPPDHRHHHSHHQHHRHHHHHHQHEHHHHHHHMSRWNRQGIPPSGSAGNGGGEGVDPRYGVQKRLVPTGPNPLHH
ncbi:hypothetical protein ACP70R_022032 [Stipagrostis hirtigluma subsp. patula]